MISKSLVRGVFHSPISRLAGVLLALLAWNSSGLCDPIHEAAEQGDLATVTALVSATPRLIGAKDEAGETPLHLAARAGHKEIVEFLLTRKADVNVRDNDGDTPLHLAARMGEKDVAELLLARKADVNSRDDGGYTP